MRTTVKTACALMMLLSVVPCLASPPEIQNFTLINTQTASWTADAASAGYHVYLATSTTAGSPRPPACHIGSWRGAEVAVKRLPAPGQVDFYLVAGFDAAGTGPLGSASNGAPRQPAPDCIPSRRSFPLVVSTSPDGLTDMEPPVNPDRLEWSSRRESTAVVLSSGEFVYEAALALLRNPGRANGGMASRSAEAPSDGPYYRSRTSYDGPLGFGWDAPWNARLSFLGGDLYLHDGTGLVHRCFGGGVKRWRPPKSLASRIIQESSGVFTLRTRTGNMIQFNDNDGSNIQGAIRSISDASGNTSSFLYDHQGLLRTIVDEMGRASTLDYDASGRVTQITDFTGRVSLIGHDFDGNLSSITTPPVTGTPTGNDFPSGKTTRFRYDKTASPGLQHNMLGITAPGQSGTQTEIMQVSYGAAPGTFEFDRVASQVIGGSVGGLPPAGGTIALTYAPLNPGIDPNDEDIERRHVTVIDRLGNQQEHKLNANGHLLELIERTNRDLRPGEPDYTTTWQVRDDGRITSVTWPAGNRTLLTYDTSGLDDYRVGNILERREVADQPATGGRGDGRGGTLADRVWTWTYEPLRNQVASATDPRGNDPAYIAPNGGAWSPDRYRTTWTFEYQEGDPAANGLAAFAAAYDISLAGVSLALGDVNGDGITSRMSGQPAIVENKKVLLADTSHQAGIEGDTLQDRRHRFVWDSRAELIAEVDAEGNRHEMTYYPETDPDGDGVPTPAPPDGRALDPNGGGYLRTVISDTVESPGRDNGLNPPAVRQRIDYTYDARGNIVSTIDPRGVLDRWTWNQLDQVVEVTRAAATADAGTALDPPTGRGEPGLSPLVLRTRYLYDANDNLVAQQREDVGGTRGLGPFLTEARRYDLLDNLVELAAPASPGQVLRHAFQYDANENLVAHVNPAASSDTWQYDERGLLMTQTTGASGPLGGAARVWSSHWDENRNLSGIVDGNGQPVDFVYDGGDRQVWGIDQLGNTGERFFDVAGQVVRFLQRGPTGGPPPADRSGATNVDLADTRYLFDEAGRLFETQERLFVPAGVVPARPPQLLEGPLAPGDGLVNTRYEYDRLDRRTFHIDDSGATTRDDYDGLSRAFRVTDSTGDPADLTLDAAGNIIETSLTESSSTPGPPAEEFVTTWFYDALGRPTLSVDTAGQALRWEHDSLGMVTRSWDARGPMGPTIERRSPGHAGMVVPINSFGNLSEYQYDGLDRLVRTAVRLSPGGVGDGTPDPVVDGNHPYILDGQIDTATLWNGVDKPTRQVDDAGNEVDYTYDNAGRLVQVMADDGRTTTYGWDGEDCRVSAIDPNGEEVVSTCDAAGQLTGTQTVCNPCMNSRAVHQSYEYDGLGRLTRASDLNDPIDPNDDVQVSWIYDGLSRPLEEAQTISDGSAPQRTSWGWAAADRNTQMTYPGGQVLSYLYDAADRVVGVNAGGGAPFAQMAWFGRSRMHTRSFTGGVRTTTLNNAGTADQGYDAAGRLTRVRHLNGLNELLAGFEYGYDRDDNRVSERRLHHPDGLGNAMGQRWSYDSAGRLTSWREAFLDPNQGITGAIAESQDWQLDGQGSWLSWQRSGGAFTATSDGNNAYQDFAGQSLTHDLNGNTVFDGLHDMEYDALGRLVSASRSSDGLVVERNVYDALGRRAVRVTADSPGTAHIRVYVYGGRDVVETHDGSGLLDLRIVRQPDTGQLLAQSDRGNKISLLMGDGQASTAAVIDRASGLVRERVTYDAHGTPYFETAQNVPELDPNGAFRSDALSGVEELFQGMQYDPATSARSTGFSLDRAGTYQLSQRTYSPYMGRFTSRDPIGVWGDAASAGNGYSFAAGNPGTMGDEDGLKTYVVPHMLESSGPIRKKGWWSFGGHGGGGGGCGGMRVSGYDRLHVLTRGRIADHTGASDASAGKGGRGVDRHVTFDGHVLGHRASSRCGVGGAELRKTFVLPHILDYSGSSRDGGAGAELRKSYSFPHVIESSGRHLFQHNESDFDFLQRRGQMSSIQSNPLYVGKEGGGTKSPLYDDSGMSGTNPLHHGRGFVVDRFTGAEVWNQPTGRFYSGPRQTTSQDGTFSHRVIPVPWVATRPEIPHPGHRLSCTGSQIFNTMTNTQKSRHDCAMNAIRNMKG